MASVPGRGFREVGMVGVDREKDRMLSSEAVKLKEVGA